MAKNFGRVNVSITASTGGLTAGLSRASKQLNTFRAGVFSMSGAMKSLNASIMPLLPMLGLFASVAGAISAFSSATRAAEELHNLSQETGVAAGDLQVLQQVAAEVGVSQQAVTMALRRTSRMVGELAQGTPAAVKAFDALGLKLGDLAGRSTADQFKIISDRIAGLPKEMQAVAAIDIFGRSGQGLLNFMRVGQQAFPEMDRLLTNLGVKMKGEQVAAIEMMGDAIGRLALPMRGFINQFLAGLAPAIMTVSTLVVQFFAKGTNGFSLVQVAVDAVTAAIRRLAGGVTFTYGVFQTLTSFVAKFGQIAIAAFSGVTSGLKTLVSAMRRVAEQLPGMNVGLATNLRNAERSLGAITNSATSEARAWGDAAAQNIADGVRNMSHPYAAFDAEFARVQALMQKAGAGAGAAAGQAAGAAIAPAIQASTQALKAVVVGTSEGEAFRNSILRGADPRNDVTRDGARTADATERTADAVEDLAMAFNEGGLGLATIGV